VLISTIAVLIFIFGVLAQFTSGKPKQTEKVVLSRSLQIKINALFFLTLHYIPERRILKMDF